MFSFMFLYVVTPQAQQERLSFIHSQGSSEDPDYDQVPPHLLDYSQQSHTHL